MFEIQTLLRPQQQQQKKKDGQIIRLYGILHSFEGMKVPQPKDQPLAVLVKPQSDFSRDASSAEVLSFALQTLIHPQIIVGIEKQPMTGQLIVSIC